eukprot:jgi/Chrpa1/351/Chrysochromulina_OHIO_Genome00012597-RA
MSASETDTTLVPVARTGITASAAGAAYGSAAAPSASGITTSSSLGALVCTCMQGSGSPTAANEHPPEAAAA